MSTVEALKNLFLDTGAGWVLWLLALLSIASLAIAIERWRLYQRNHTDIANLARGLAGKLDSISDDDEKSINISAAIDWLTGQDTVAARVAHAGLTLSNRGTASVAKAMDSRLTLERHRLNRRLSFLGTLGNNAPFIGLFGTVIGVIQAFEELGHSAAGHAGLTSDGAGQVASGAVMSAISEALVATAVGILVAIPAVAAFNYLKGRATAIVSGSEAVSDIVLAYLSTEVPTTQNTISQMESN